MSEAKARDDRTAQEEITGQPHDAAREAEQDRTLATDQALWKELSSVLDMARADRKLSAQEKKLAKRSIDTALRNAETAGLAKNLVEQRRQMLYDMLGLKTKPPKPEKPAQPKTEVEYAQDRGAVREQIEALPGEALTEGRKALFPDADWYDAVERATDIMRDKAAGKNLTAEEEKIYKKLKKLGIRDIDPVATENAKAAAEQGEKLNMKTTEKGQATITRRGARKKVNDPNSETCGI